MAIDTKLESVRQPTRLSACPTQFAKTSIVVCTHKFSAHAKHAHIIQFNTFQTITGDHTCVSPWHILFRNKKPCNWVFPKLQLNSKIWLICLVFLLIMAKVKKDKLQGSWMVTHHRISLGISCLTSVINYSPSMPSLLAILCEKS